MKLILKNAEQLRFIVPISYDQIKESRGNKARHQLQVIKNMINTDYSKLVASIQPIITKGVPGDDEADIDFIRSNLHDIFSHDMTSEINTHK